MLLKWICCVFLIVLIIDVDLIDCGFFSSSRSSGSRSSSSRGSSSSGSRSSTSYGTRNSGYRTTPRPTRRTTRYYPVTTMPTRRTTRYHPVTTMPTRRTTRYHPVTTMPTRRTTRYHPVTTMPTRRTTPTRQPPYNPHYNSSKITSKQPPYNPFFSSTTKQPPYNPFWTSTSRTNHSSGLGVTKQPPYNPFLTPTTKATFYSSTPSHHFNGSNFHTTPSYNNNNGRPLGIHTTKMTSLGSGRNNYTNSNQNNFGQTPRPVYTTSKPNYQPKYNSSRPINQGIRPTYNTTKPFYQGPVYNTSNYKPVGSSVRPGNAGVYQPPVVHRNSTFTTGSGRSPNYPVQHLVNPVQPSHTTTIINNNNNNNHYYGRPGYYTPGSSGNTHVTIINNNYNPNHHVIIPSTHYYSYGPPALGISVVNTNYYDPFSTSHYRTTYHYSTYDTGSTSLGFFLGYQLGRINRPSYYYHSTTYVDHEYVPRYDHYTVHHYYHNADNIPTEAPIQPNAVVTCAGDSSNLCPPGNYPLCTNNGAVMCVVSASSTQPCSTNSRKLNCVTSTIPCEGNNSPECKQKSSTSVSIPCVSTASIAAGVNYVNNSIIVTDAGDTSVKNFCVTVLALPTKNETKTNTTIEPKVPFQYTTNITGVDILGYYLGYKLQKLLEPSYNYLNYDANYNYVEKYDHYDVFHYYHGGNFLAEQVEFKAEQMMSCAGDSGTFCPSNTLSLCLNDGSVACVTDISTTSFNNYTKTNYLNSTIACDKLKSPVCISNQTLNLPVQIPCISKAKVYANVSFMVKNYGNGIENVYYRTIEVVNGTQNVTAPREFCVAILVTPGIKFLSTTPDKRQITGIPNSKSYQSLPKYNYNPGNKTIEAYMAYRLGIMAYPTIYYMNAYWFSVDGTIQKYDHYTPISYYSGKEVIPKFLEFQAFDLRACDGDSGLFCPTNTSSICLNDGAVMCLTDLMLTVPCLKYNDTVCVRSTVSCANNYPCQKTSRSKRVSIPCISTATIYGDVKLERNYIYKKIPSAAKLYENLQPIPGTNVNNTPVYHKAQQFCVTLTALPAERIISEGEKFLEGSESLFGRITSKIFGF
ncbi:mucin-2-like isoform X1 [Diorhabda carinulata]|uniref:mucin-2-like isoform X1 n=1 Tax=Diorhabda carinulata TaxID=1163345 RepID=UPI0025A1E29A|nr:mucin-2-like isoform X1 [Diorhabda carinulata]